MRTVQNLLQSHFGVLEIQTNIKVEICAILRYLPLKSCSKKDSNGYFDELSQEYGSIFPIFFFKSIFTAASFKFTQSNEISATSVYIFLMSYFQKIWQSFKLKNQDFISNQTCKPMWICNTFGKDTVSTLKHKTTQDPKLSIPQRYYFHEIMILNFIFEYS